jgi:uncharacterized phiE125 gp8 family phage protein
MSYKLISSGNELPVSVSGFKNAINFNADGKDDTIELFLKAAINEAELFTGRQFKTQTWELQLTDFSETVLIGKSPVTGINSVVYFNNDNDEVQMTSGTDYYIDTVSEPAEVHFLNTPSVYAYRPDAVKITFTVGHVNGLHEDVTAAVYMAAGAFFVNPTDSVRQFPTASKNLLRNYRLYNE